MIVGFHWTGWIIWMLGLSVTPNPNILLWTLVTEVRFKIIFSSSLFYLINPRILVWEFKLFSLRRQSNIKHILKTSLIILSTAETVSILTAKTVDLVFYNYSLLLSILIALLAGHLQLYHKKPIRKLGIQTVREIFDKLFS